MSARTGQTGTWHRPPDGGPHPPDVRQPFRLTRSALSRHVSMRFSCKHRRPVAGQAGPFGVAQGRQPDVRAPRGILLLEMIVYCIIVVAIVGVLSSSIFFATQSLRKRAERELNDERWLTLVETLRDDLRSAVQVHWRPNPQKGQPGRLLTVKWPDGTVVEWLSDNGQMFRRVTNAKGKTVETPHPFQTTSWKLSVPRDGSEGLWDLRELPADTQVSAALRPAFFYLTVGVHGQDRRIVPEQLGVSTRCEAQEAQR